MDPPASTSRVFCFGQFEARVDSGKLLHHTREVKLQDQPFRLLVALVERQGSVVSRQELKDSLWPNGTVEFDKSLDVAMAKLRHALNDDSSSPRFIETLPKRGYRFIAPVTASRDAALPPELPATVPAPAAAAPQGAPPASPRMEEIPSPVSPRPAGSAVAVLGLIVLTAALAGTWYWQSHRAATLMARAPVMVGEFTNNTGDPLFDRSLRTAAIIDLGQSPYLTVVSDRRIGDALQALGRPPDDPLEPAILRQICQREHAAAAINGAIERADAGYLVSIVASRCSDGSILATSGFRVAATERVLVELAKAITSLRQRFGESKESLRQYDVVAVQATTNSLAALKAYQLGLDLRSRTLNFDAIPAFKASIRLDPTFAIAYAQLGSCYSNVQDTELATVYFQKAFELREHATEPERLYIAGRYFDIVTGEVEKGASIYKLWTEIYPNDWLGHNAVANDANMVGRFDMAATAAQRVIALEPDHAYGYTNRAVALLGLNRLAEAADAGREAVRRGRDGGVIHSVLFAVALINNDQAGLAQERARAARLPDEQDIPFLEAELAEAQGRVKASTRMFAQVAEKARRLGVPGNAAAILASEAEFDVEMGLRDLGLVHANAAAQLGTNEQTLEWIALVHARAGEPASVHALSEQINSRFPLSTYNISVFAPTIRTALAMGTLSSSQVTEWMRPAIPYEAGRQAVLTPIYIRGLAYLNANAGEAAEQEFRKLIDHRGSDATSPLYPLAYLRLAESLVAQGRVREAASAYEFVLAFWKDADPDLPVLLQAQREYQLLKHA